MQAVKSKLSALHAKHQEALKAAQDCEDELAGIIEKAEALEQLTEEKTAELNEIEDQLDAAESQLSGQILQLGTSEKAAEEGLQARKQLENRGANDEKRIQELEAELEIILNENASVVDSLEQLVADLQEKEETLDNEDERVEISDARVKELESEVTQVGNSLRSMEICEKEGNDRVSSSDGKMIDIENRYKEKDIEATEWESKSEELEQQSDALDEELNQARLAYDATKVEFDALISEINEI